MKLIKGIDYKYQIPRYAPFRIGEVVRICNKNNIKKYANSKEPYMNQLGVVIGYSTKSGSGPMTFAVRVIETNEVYMLYNYLLMSTGHFQRIPKFEPNDEVINKTNKIDGKWVKIIKPLNDDNYEVEVFKDKSKQTIKERSLRLPTIEELQYKNLEQKLPELEGIF
jgi:DNA-directed RNA polymerase subunit H (RpoH/RPB5)